MDNLNLLETVLAVVLMSGGTWCACDVIWHGLTDWWAERKEQERDGYSDPARPRMVARSAHASTAPTVRDRASVARGVATARDSRPFHFPASAHASETGESLDRRAGYGETTRLTIVPKGDAA